MTEDNVIDLTKYRGRVFREEEGPASDTRREADLSKEAVTLLNELHNKARIDHDDRPFLADNLGRIIVQLEPKTPEVVAKRILGSSQWEKRKRYIRFPDDRPTTSRYAASGGDFAGIIRQLVELKLKVHKGFSRDQATVKIVNDALKRTSFRRSPQFQMPIGKDDNASAAIFVNVMERVLNNLAQAADLADYFDLLSKYPIYPADSRSSSRLLELSPHGIPIDLCRWEHYLEEELQYIGLWWAPKCVIGHLYIPFQWNCLEPPKHAVAEVKNACGGEITDRTWNEECSQLLEPFLTSEWITSRRVYHRLPIWLIALPSQNKLVYCLYATIHYWDNFQWGDAARKGAFNSYYDTITPCFVDCIGERLNNDSVYFREEADFPFFICPFDERIKLIGEDFGEGVENFQADLSYPLSEVDELPYWLHNHPVQRLLQLTMDSDTAQVFALSPRMFTTSGYLPGDDETVFRPTFSDPVTACTPLRQNTIAAYLLRNFANADDIFEALKNDALAKAAAATELINSELLKFQDAFDKRYGK